MKNITYVSQPVSHMRNVFENDPAGVGLIKEPQRPSQKMFMNG